MPNPSGQDEARRALAGEIEELTRYGLKRMDDGDRKAARVYAEGVCDLLFKNIPIILSALRTPSIEGSAEEMRERAARAAEWFKYNPARGDVIAASIRALPLPPDRKGTEE